MLRSAVTSCRKAGLDSWLERQDSLFFCLVLFCKHVTIYELPLRPGTSLGSLHKWFRIWVDVLGSSARMPPRLEREGAMLTREDLTEVLVALTEEDRVALLQAIRGTGTSPETQVGSVSGVGLR